MLFTSTLLSIISPLDFSFRDDIANRMMECSNPVGGTSFCVEGGREPVSFLLLTEEMAASFSSFPWYDQKGYFEHLGCLEDCARVMGVSSIFFFKCYDAHYFS